MGVFETVGEWFVLKQEFSLQCIPNYRSAALANSRVFSSFPLLLTIIFFQILTGDSACDVGTFLLKSGNYFTWATKYFSPGNSFLLVFLSVDEISNVKRGGSLIKAFFLFAIPVDFACYFVLLVKERGRKAEKLWAFLYLTVVLCDIPYYCGIIISILKHFEQYLINDCYSVEVIIISIFFLFYHKFMQQTTQEWS